MKKILAYSLGVMIVAAVAGCHTTKVADGSCGKWKVLFDGTEQSYRDNFRSYRYDATPTNGWYVKEGEIRFKPNSKAGDLATRQKYRAFDVEFEYKISKNGNSGIKYRIADLEQGYPLGCEYQILDDDGHPDAKLGRDGNRKTASLYDVIPAPTDKKQNLPGEWNKVLITVRDDKVEHFLNGGKTVSYNPQSAEFDEAVAKSKFKDYKGWGKPKDGYLAFQDHNDEVAYRNIRIRPVCMETK